MAVEMLSYADLAARLKISPEAARALAKRHRLPRSRSNDGKTLVTIDLTEIDHKPLAARSPGGHQAVTTPLKARIEALQAELARLQATASGHRADFERERDRADRLAAELLKTAAETMAARELIARLQGESKAITAPLKTEIDILQTELAMLRDTATGHRADFERERDRADRLMAELLKATLDAMTAKDATAQLESKMIALRSQPWWRRLVG